MKKKVQIAAIPKGVKNRRDIVIPKPPVKKEEPRKIRKKCPVCGHKIRTTVEAHQQGGHCKPKKGGA